MQGYGPWASFGFTRGPNGEMVPVMLNPGRNPFQQSPTPIPMPGYSVPGYPGG